MDTLILIVLGIGAAIGFYQGAFKQIANFIGVALGLFLASMLYQQCGDYLADKSGASASTAHMVAFVIIVILVPVVLGWMASLLTKVASSIHLGFLNRLAGAVLGIVSYGLILSFACNGMDFLESKFGYHPELLEERSDLFYTVKHASQPVIPDIVIVADSTEVAHGAPPKQGVKDVVDKAVDQAGDIVNETVKSMMNPESDKHEEEE
ncbi:MAG: CvpA family protein [Bacteroidaceae bacterium]|jgi:membrane protein required for colicin V production|nr:CvpA family protein [Bacteroidaceae bacterium]